MIEPWPADFIQPQGMGQAPHGTPGWYAVQTQQRLREALAEIEEAIGDYRERVCIIMGETDTPEATAVVDATNAIVDQIGQRICRARCLWEGGRVR